MTVTDQPRTEQLVGGAARADAGGRKLRMATPPVFETVGEERAHRKAKLAAAFRMFSRAGLDEGVAGHITVRDPAEPETFWVNPFGMHFSMIRSSDLVRVDEAYSAAAGHGSKPRQIGHEEATVTRGQVGYESAGWFQFQPIWERISRDEPDLFE